jgi:hypothetical protein
MVLLMNSRRAPCCSSPATICYWFVISVLAWGALSLIGVYWHPLQTSRSAACLLAMAIGCLANWLRNRSFHCVITGPLFLIAGVVFLLSDVDLISIGTRWVWPIVLILASIALLWEWRFTGRAKQD